MKRVLRSDVERLELISIKLERIPKEKMNKILEDMLWLTQKLREAHRIIEEESQ